MPRRSVVEAEKTRQRIVNRAVDVASVDGLEGVTIGRLADDLAMSKAGVIGQFGSKTDLQLAALERASEVFQRDVWQPAADKRPGLERLLAVCDGWIGHISSRAFPGGCFWTSASVEYDARDGALHEQVRDGLARWRATLRRDVRRAIDDGELARETDAEQVVFELQSMAMGLNQAVQLFSDRRAAARARRAVRRILGL